MNLLPNLQHKYRISLNKILFLKSHFQSCDEMILLVTWRLNETGKVVEFSKMKFSKSFTDYGVCCRIFPQLNFDNPETRKIPVSEYKSKLILTNALYNMI